MTRIEATKLWHLQAAAVRGKCIIHTRKHTIDMAGDLHPLRRDVPFDDDEMRDMQRRRLVRLGVQP